MKLYHTYSLNPLCALGHIKSFVVYQCWIFHMHQMNEIRNYLFLRLSVHNCLCPDHPCLPSLHCHPFPWMPSLPPKSGFMPLSNHGLACVAGVKRGGGRGGGREFRQKTEDLHPSVFFLFLLPYPLPFIRLLRRLITVHNSFLLHSPLRMPSHAGYIPK